MNASANDLENGKLMLVHTSCSLQPFFLMIHLNSDISQQSRSNFSSQDSKNMDEFVIH